MNYAGENAKLNTWEHIQLIFTLVWYRVRNVLEI